MKRLILTLFLMLLLIPSTIWAGSANDYDNNPGIVTVEDSLIGLDNKDADPGWSMNQFTFATILTWIQNNIYPNAALTGDPTITDASPSLTFQDSNDAAGTASFYANSSGGSNDIIWIFGVEDSSGENQSYFTLDGVNERIEFHKPLYGLGSWLGDFKIDNAIPTIIYNDTNGLDTNDQEASKSLSEMSTVTSGSEVSDRRETFKNAGTRQTYSLWDGSAFTFTIGVLTDDWTGGDVANYESLKWDFDTGNDAEVVVTSPSGATKLDFQITTVEVDALTVSTSIDLGASDTTIERSGAGDATIEGKQIYREDGGDIKAEDIGTGDLSIGSIGGTTAMNVQRLVKVIEKTTDASLTANECADTIITTRGWSGVADQTLTLPEADTSEGVGLKFLLIALVTDANEDLYIDTEGSTTNIYLNGDPIGDGFRVKLDGPTVGEQIGCFTVTLDGSTYDWVCNTILGAWITAGS